MTHFEYIFVAVSIVLSFTILRLLDAMPSAFSTARGYWVHAVWVLFLLYSCAAFWWLNWFNRELDSLSFRYLLFLLVVPGTLYLSATALVSAAPATVSSWREHFFLHRRGFFLGFLVYITLLSINSSVTFEVSMLYPMRAWQAFLVLLFGCGASMSSERAQRRVAAVAAVALALVLGFALAGRIQLSFD